MSLEKQLREQLLYARGFRRIDAMDETPVSQISIEDYLNDKWAIVCTDEYIDAKDAKNLVKAWDAVFVGTTSKWVPYQDVIGARNFHIALFAIPVSQFDDFVASKGIRKKFNNPELVIDVVRIVKGADVESFKASLQSSRAPSCGQV